MNDLSVFHGGIHDWIQPHLAHVRGIKLLRWQQNDFTVHKPCPHFMPGKACVSQSLYISSVGEIRKVLSPPRTKISQSTDTHCVISLFAWQGAGMILSLESSVAKEVRWKFRRWVSVLSTFLFSSSVFVSWRSFVWFFFCCDFLCRIFVVAMVLTTTLYIVFGVCGYLVSIMEICLYACGCGERRGRERERERGGGGGDF